MRIRLKCGRVVLIDKGDVATLHRHSWRSLPVPGSDRVYVVTAINKKTIYLHRLIMKPKDNLVVDHINHNCLDNRRSNLRIVTRQQNQWNLRKVKRDAKSKYKGVTKKRNKWECRVFVSGKIVYRKSFENEVDAALAYNHYSTIYFGNNGLKNEVNEPSYNS